MCCPKVPHLYQTRVEPDGSALRGDDARPLALADAAALQGGLRAKVPHVNPRAGLAAELAMSHVAASGGGANGILPDRPKESVA